MFVAGKNVKKIVIITPNIDSLNGVAIHYRGLKRYWKWNVDYFFCEKRQNVVTFPFIMFFSLVRFIGKLLRDSVKLVVLNVSLKRGFYSQILYLLVAKLVGCKSILFIHGWDVQCEEMLQSRLSRWMLHAVSGVVVLSNSFGSVIRQLYESIPIYLSTTKVEDSMLDNFDISCRTGKINRFLFVSRVEEQKGIFLSLKIYEKLKNTYPDVSFHIVGDGSAMEGVRDYIMQHGLKDVVLTGRLDGEDLCREYRDADFFFLLSYSEGLPAALLEAMAFGLPVVTRSVGGIPDFFKDGEMGMMSESLDPQDYYVYICKCMQNPLLVRAISQKNYNFAKKHFLASAVACRMESIFDKILNSKR